MDESFIKEHNIPSISSSNFPKIYSIGGIQYISSITIPFILKYKNHFFIIQFYITNLPFYCCIIGFEWLKTHNPSINLLKWSSLLILNFAILIVLLF